MKINKAGVPAGTIIDFGGGACPSGYLLCDGSTFSRAQYPALFAAIGVSHGSGDGVATAHLPDRRGRFVRGSDNMGSGAAGRDSDSATRTASNAGGNTGNTPGSVQDSANKLHDHPITMGHNGATNNSAYASYYSSPANLVTNRSPIGDDGSTEARPQNCATIFAIKY